ncbi:MAG: hypothetical protein HXS53_06360 [Theionarchaea archaeon]|nr:hypothetical protein [Theionarchaea archaeon]
MPPRSASSNLTEDFLVSEFARTISDLSLEPRFQRGDRIGYAVDRKNQPAVKLAMAQVPLSYDLWEGLKNPAGIGLHPVGIREIWEFYAHRRITGIDEAGRPTIFQIPLPFDRALNQYRCVLIISVMLPFSPLLMDEYADSIMKNTRGSSHLFTRMCDEINALLDSATSRVAIELMGEKRIVVPLVNTTIQSISQEAIPLTHQGAAHGPSKGGNFPQKSIAALLGLGQFGVNRIIFRDEQVGNSIHRFVGPLRSILIFDSQMNMDEEGTIIPLTSAWRKFLMRLYDFTDTDPEINRYRFCTHVSLEDEGCEMCRIYCPSGAQSNSMPERNGTFPLEIIQQKHRFWNGTLQFDYRRCCEERGQMTEIFPEWSCSRALSVCAAKGKRRIFSAAHFYDKRAGLNTQ